MTEEHKRKIGISNSIRMKEVWKREDHRKRITEAKKGKIPKGLAKAHTKEAIAKMAETKKILYRDKTKHPRYKHGLSGTLQMATIYNNKRRALKYASEKRLSLPEWERIKAEYRYVCACCLQKVKLTIDHIIPLSKGGSDGYENIQPLCITCNQKKRFKTTKYPKPSDTKND